MMTAVHMIKLLNNVARSEPEFTVAGPSWRNKCFPVNFS